MDLCFGGQVFKIFDEMWRKFLAVSCLNSRLLADFSYYLQQFYVEDSSSLFPNVDLYFIEVPRPHKNCKYEEIRSIPGPVIQVLIKSTIATGLTSK